ncbi:hypothetical protein QJQ45_000218 [Haematococcus lacustris]|nr:hypothetical protein QJQ45_000218 [Haematococcus lacustris]
MRAIHAASRAARLTACNSCPQISGRSASHLALTHPCSRAPRALHLRYVADPFHDVHDAGQKDPGSASWIPEHSEIVFFDAEPGLNAHASSEGIQRPWGPGSHRPSPPAVSAHQASAVHAFLSVEQQPPKTGSSPKRPGDDGEFALNFGSAVRVLREELPEALDQALSQHIYRPDLQLTTPWGSMSRGGLTRYNTMHTALRRMVRMATRHHRVELRRLWSPQSGLLRARLHVWLLPWWGRVDAMKAAASSQARALEGRAAHDPSSWSGAWQADLLFTYRFDDHGKVQEHVVEWVVPPDQTSVPQLALPFVVSSLIPSLEPRRPPGVAVSSSSSSSSSSRNGGSGGGGGGSGVRQQTLDME